MLADQHRRRRGDGDLPPGENRECGGAQRDLGLAVADVADHEPVGRLAAGKVGAHRRDRPRLIGGLGIAETRGEALVSGAVRRDGRGRARTTCRRQFGQPARGLGDRDIDAGAALRPARSVELVERHGVRLGPVAPDPVGIGNRHLPPSAVGELEHQRLAGARRIASRHRVQRRAAGGTIAAVRRRTRPGQRFEPDDDGDAEVLVDDDLADMDDARAAVQRVVRLHRPRVALSPAAEHVGGGEHEPARCPPAVVDRHRQCQQRARRARRDLAPRSGSDVVELERFAEPRADEAHVARRSRDHHRRAVGKRGFGGVRQRPKRRPTLDEARHRLGLSGRDHLPRGQRRIPCRRIGDRDAQPRLGPPRLIDERDVTVAARCGIGVEPNGGTRQMVEQRHRRVAQRRLVGMPDIKPVERRRGQLCHRIEAADVDDAAALGVDLDPRRLPGIGGEDVDDMAPHCQHAGLVGLVVVGIADRAQIFGKGVQIERIAELDLGRCHLKCRRPRIQLRRGLGRDDQRRASVAPPAQGPERRHPPSDVRRRRGCAVARQCVARRHLHDQRVRSRNRERRRQRLGAGLVRRDIQHIARLEPFGERHSGQSDERRGFGG